MKKRILIVLAIIITLAICLTGCSKKVELGERYDSDKILVSEDGSMEHKNRLTELYDKYSKAASETQFVVHEKTAIAIAEAVIKEIYPDEDYQVLYLPTYPKALYYEAENCWEVWLYISSSRNKPVAVYIDVSSGAVKAIIPSTEF